MARKVDDKGFQQIVENGKLPQVQASTQEPASTKVLIVESLIVTENYLSSYQNLPRRQNLINKHIYAYNQGKTVSKTLLL